MISCKVTSDVEKEMRATATRLRRFSRNAVETFETVVEREKAEHKYQNRTGKTEATTRALVFSGPGTADGDVHVRVEMEAGHATYLQKDGWSRFVKLIDAAIRKVKREAEKL